MHFSPIDLKTILNFKNYICNVPRKKKVVQECEDEMYIIFGEV
jgi:hypothetical protein